MTITIHRGTHQIGGCVTEICTQQSRIFIDFGTELPDLDGTRPEENLSISGLTEVPVNCDGVFFTHYHGDHVGNIHRILPDIPVYMGEAAQRISLILTERLQKAYKYHCDNFENKGGTIEALQRVRVYHDGKAICIKDIKITPYRVDHSAFDAYMLLIEAEGKRILHTGDFRDHGYTGAELADTLVKIGKIDALLCEGTMLSRSGETVLTEAELEAKAQQIMAEHKYIFVLCSSTNIDRIRAFYTAKPKNRPGVCDFYQKQILDAVENFDPTSDNSYQFDWVVPDAEWNYKLHNWMEQEGFLMFVRASDRFKEAMEPYRNNCKVIYSMWKGYLQKPSIQDFLNGYECEMLHTSGHATTETIRALVAALDPVQIVPIHTEKPDIFTDLFPERTVLTAQDGVPITL